MNTRHLLLVFSLFLAVMGFSRDSMTDVEKTTTQGYHDQWRSLWEEHIGWTRSVIFLILDGPANQDLSTVAGHPYVVRLLKNYEDMEDALRPYYADADVEEFGDLVKDHLVIAAELLIAAKAQPFVQSNFDDAKTRWYANAAAISAKMAQMNPKSWPASMGEPMWTSHLDATLDEAVSHLSANADGEVAAFDTVHAMALDMADFFSAGVVNQFNGRFSGARPRM